MSNKITTCKVNNKLNETEVEELTVCTEWSDKKIKVIIVRKDNILIGETFEKDFETNAKFFDKEPHKFLEDTQNILSGKKEDVEFILKENKFYWKKKKFRLSPEIVMESISKNRCFSSFVSNLINHFSIFESNALDLEKNNETFKRTQSQLSNKLNEIIAYKIEFEIELYKKFISVLNSKKEKIRQLKIKLDKFENKNNPMYDAVTEESEEECNNKINSSQINKYTNKRTCTDELNFEKEGKQKKCKANEVIESTLIFTNKNQPCASTSKYILPQNLGEDDDTPDFFNSQESECEVELKFEEDSEEIF